MDQNHLGKFLKMNSLEYPVIEYQLFNFAKESLKQIFLNSKCGELINGKEFKDKPPSTDLLGNKNIYPLACLYKKGKPKIKSDKQLYSWNPEKTKKKVDMLSNSYMTLSILELACYYDEIIYNDKKRQDVVKFYVSSAKCQLNYYLDNFRNELGLFVNKFVVENNEGKKDKEVIFENTGTSFDFSCQSYLMSSFYKCSHLLKETSPYKVPFLNFSREMENMFVDFKDKIFKLTPRKIVELLHSFSLYINLNQCINNQILHLSLNIIEDFFSKHSLSSLSTYDKILLYNTLSKLKSLLNKSTFEQLDESRKLISEYIWDLDDIFSSKGFYKNEITDAYDLISYQLYLLNFNKELSHEFYNDVLIPSKIFSSFPNIPKRYESEKYFKFNHKDDFIIPDKYFKPSSYKTMDEANVTPIICKELYFSQEKNKFSKPKAKFDSSLNMRLIHLMILMLKDTIIKATK